MKVGTLVIQKMSLFKIYGQCIAYLIGSSFTSGPMPPTLYMSVCVLVLFSIRSGGLSVASDRSIAMVACVA
jgi:hypothetical protein